MKTMLPLAKPQITKEKALAYLSHFDVATYKVKLLGLRGYFKTTMGDPEANDIGIYDDAICLVSDKTFEAWNANTDPSKQYKGIATLKPGGPYIYKIGMHNMHNPYQALRQHGNVTVLRDGIPVTDSPGNRFYIDIHKGGYATTSSLGCQTIPPVQWFDFLDTVKRELNIADQDRIPYVLVEL